MFLLVYLQKKEFIYTRYSICISIIFSIILLLLLLHFHPHMQGRYGSGYTDTS
jgi:hypothetical protein